MRATTAEWTFGGERDVGDEHAVDTEAHAGLVGHRLDMDVGCALLGRVAQNRRNDLGHRRVFGDSLGARFGDLGLLEAHHTALVALLGVFLRLHSKLGLELAKRLPHFAGEAFVEIEQLFEIRNR